LLFHCVESRVGRMWAGRIESLTVGRVGGGCGAGIKFSEVNTTTTVYLPVTDEKR